MTTDFNPFLEYFEEKVLPQIMQSGLLLVIVTDNLDSKLCLEVGAAVLLDKPVIICTRNRSLVSASLEKIASKIVLMPADWNTKEAEEAVHEAIKGIVGEEQE